MIAPRSSAISVHYDLRPAKQAERRIFLQIFLSAAHLQFPISSARYVGMGGFKYYDFITLHRYLNINRMVSIEHDPLIIPRCNFNKPFGFITLFEGEAAQFISADDFAGPNIVWLDYDQGISENVLQDLIDLGSKLQPNSFLIVSVRAVPTRGKTPQNVFGSCVSSSANLRVTLVSKTRLTTISDARRPLSCVAS